VVDRGSCGGDLTRFTARQCEAYESRGTKAGGGLGYLNPWGNASAMRLRLKRFSVQHRELARANLEELSGPLTAAVWHHRRSRSRRACTMFPLTRFGLALSSDMQTKRFSSSGPPWIGRQDVKISRKRANECRISCLTRLVVQRNAQVHYGL
jgi:hypothetical protein